VFSVLGLDEATEVLQMRGWCPSVDTGWGGGLCQAAALDLRAECKR
jgi:hypothetical protein